MRQDNLFLAFFIAGKDEGTMTEEQKNKITELRLQGYGYKTIAAMVGDGVKRENVRYFCKSRGLVGTPDLVGMNFDAHRDNPNFCKQCGLRLIRNKHSGVKLFCSDKCRRAWWKQHPNENGQTKKKAYELTCEYCHSKFISYGKADRKYCSHDCYIKQRFWTDPEAKVTPAEIKKRQEAKEASNEDVELVLKRIS